MISMIPWIKLITTGANVVEIARDIYVTVKRTNKAVPETINPTVSELQTKIKLLEENEERQAALVTKMAEQQQMITDRLIVLYIVSIGSLVIAIFSVVIHFWT